MIVSKQAPTQWTLTVNANTRGRNDSPHLYNSAAAAIARTNHEAYCRRHGYHCEMLLRYSDVAEASASKHRHTKGSYLWAKVPLVTTLLRKGFAGVLTIDSDALVKNMAVTIESLLERAGTNRSIVVSGDSSVIHTAQALYLNTPWTRELLQSWWQMPDAPLWEQGALQAWLCGCSAPSSWTAKKVKACFQRGKGLDVQLTRRIKQGDRSVFKSLGITQQVSDHIGYLPQRALNAYVDHRKQSSEIADVCKRKGHANQGLGGEDVSFYRPGDFIMHFPGESAKCKDALLPKFANGSGGSDNVLLSRSEVRPEVL